MKKTYNKILLIATLVSMVALNSCSDFLEEENKTGQTADLTYATASGIQGLVSGCYSFARGFYGKEPGLGLSEMGTDLFYAGQDNKQRSLVNYTFSAASLDNDVSDNPCFDQYWEMFYCAVDACNNALVYIPQNTMIDEKVKNQYLGEIYFLKAFYHFHMVNIWGDIPYNDEPIIAVTTEPVRMPEAEVYGKILADLDKSIAAFDAAGFVTKAAAGGRANYWAARALKARVLLYKASWFNDDAAYASAQTEAEAVIGSGEFSFYDNYADTWYLGNEDVTVNKEAIFGITYSSDLKTNVNCIPKRYRTNASGKNLDYNSLITRTGYSRGGNAMLLMFVSLWNNGCTDIGSDVFARITSDNPGTMKHSVTGQAVRVAEHYSPYGRGFTRYLPSLYLWKTLEQYRATDQRTDATLLTAYTIHPGMAGSSKTYSLMTDTAIYYCGLDGNSPAGQAAQARAKDRYRIQFMYGGDIPVYSSGDVAQAKPTSTAKNPSDVYGGTRYNNAKIGGLSSFPGIRKFLDTKYDPTYPTHDISYRDAIVLRLAEMYLIKAECQLKTGGDALATLNQLRDVRAITGQNNKRTGTVTIDTILEERAIELCGEQQRWFDLKRTHKLVEYVKARNAVAAPQVAEKHYYRPIPQAQIDAVTNLGTGFSQNEGY